MTQLLAFSCATPRGTTRTLLPTVLVPSPPPPSLKKSTKTRWRKNITLLLTFPWIHKCSTCFPSFSVNSSISKFWKATIFRFVFLMVDWTLKKRNRIRAQEIKWSSIQENSCGNYFIRSDIDFKKKVSFEGNVSTAPNLIFTFATNSLFRQTWK